MAKTLRSINNNARKIGELRAAIAEIEDKAAPLKKQLKALEDAHLADMLDAGAESIKSVYGTHVVSRSTVFDVEDWRALDAWAIAHKAPEVYQRRVSISAVREHIDAGDKVPGIVERVNTTLRFTAAKLPGVK